ncbi:MAG TPA: DUF6457 domain-containing protein [Jiangellales bacterium]|nr:DUF6457 domain-containing protein [Jiangellales bacterium]
MLKEWVQELAEALGLDPAEVDAQAVLDLARDAAHGVARPAAPVTTFLVGLAAGRAGGDAEAVAAASRTAAELVRRRAEAQDAGDAGIAKGAVDGGQDSSR